MAEPSSQTVKMLNELAKEGKKNNSERWDARNSGPDVGGGCWKMVGD